MKCQLAKWWLEAFKDIRFLVKLAALALVMVIIGLWRLPEKGDNGMSGSWQQETLWAHTVPAYSIVLGTNTVIYLLGERPGVWNYRFFMIPGCILFCVTGYFALHNSVSSKGRLYPTIIGGLCYVVAAILFVEVLLNERIWRICSSGKERKNKEATPDELEDYVEDK